MSRVTTLITRISSTLLGVCLVLATGTAAAVERVTYYHNDALGSPVAATDAGGTLLWREEYQPYGSRIKREAGSRDTVWYTGKQEESATGLSYFGSRWYDPALGRFMAMDPVWFTADNVASFSKYAYANNNPYVYVDPDGREALTPEQEIMQTRAEAFGKIRSVINPVGEVGQATLEMATPGIGLLGVVTRSGKIADKFSQGKKALVDMAKQDKRKGITTDDMKAYKDLNKELPDPFPSNKVRGPEVHPNRSIGKEPHGHVGPVDHIPIKKQ